MARRILNALVNAVTTGVLIVAWIVVPVIVVGYALRFLLR